MDWTLKKLRFAGRKEGASQIEGKGTKKRIKAKPVEEQRLTFGLCTLPFKLQLQRQAERVVS